MALIALEGMRFYAYHGFYEEEQVIGTEFVLDIYIQTRSGFTNDDLANTVNYETVYFICQTEMRKKAKLLETVVERILDRLQKQFGFKIAKVRVRLKKLNPPLGGRVDCAFIEMER